MATALAPAARPTKLSFLIGLAVATTAAVFVFLQLRPDLIFSATTPSGGDMGAHVWGPAYLRDNLLTSGRLIGWTPDWYAGFPAYHFYMVIPSLAIIVVNAGFHPILGLPLAVAVAAGGFAAGRKWPAYRVAIWSLAALVAVGMVSTPYGAAFKIVSVLGLVFFPLSAWAMGRLSGASHPVPAFLALAGTIFIFDTNFSIYGGNVASTLAGEFAFSISLAIALLAIGWVLRGMDLDQHRATAAVLLALVALTHIIPLIFTMVAVGLAVLIPKSTPRWWVIALGATLALVPVGLYQGGSATVRLASVAAFGVVAIAMAAASPEITRRIIWIATAGVPSMLLAAFWLWPFYLRSDYFNDMGWERLNEVGPALLTAPMKIALPLAAVSAVIAFAYKDRLGMIFTIIAFGSAAAVANLPDGKLWNARLLPFYYLSVYLLVAVGAGLLVRILGTVVSERLDKPDPVAMFGLTGAALAVTLVGISFPLQALPFGGSNNQGTYSWLGIEGGQRSFVPSWVAWNYSGYEEKNSYREYRDVVNTMASVGQQNGCGRAMWEYDRTLDRYGTPMALMLLPHWTDGCVGSMEGLYFESSASTPFHFLNQSMLSVAPSRAQRDLPYQNFNIDRGIAQLQVTGVRYYMAQSDEAIAAARGHEDLVEVAESAPFVVFEVANTDLVEGLAVQPVVAQGQTAVEVGELASRFESGWVSQAVAFYNDPDGFSAIPAEDGPDSWETVSALIASDGQEITPATVSNLDIRNSSIEFTVDQIGSPVLVKTSFFPNWKASGADGPWRAGPNLMVVVPTDTNVKLSYGYTLAEISGYLFTLLGIVGLFALAAADRKKLGVVSPGVDVAHVEHEPSDSAPTDSSNGVAGGVLFPGHQTGPDLPTEPHPGVQEPRTPESAGVPLRDVDLDDDESQEFDDLDDDLDDDLGDDLDERIEPGLIAALLAQETAVPNPPDPEIGVADRMLAALHEPDEVGGPTKPTIGSTESSQPPLEAPENPLPS